MKKILLVTILFMLIVSSYSQEIKSLKYFKKNFIAAGATMKECEVNKNKSKKELQNCKNAWTALAATLIALIFCPMISMFRAFKSRSSKMILTHNR